jgi:hypothetical protein
MKILLVIHNISFFSKQRTHVVRRILLLCYAELLFSAVYENTGRLVECYTKYIAQYQTLLEDLWTI